MSYFHQTTKGRTRYRSVTKRSPGIETLIFAAAFAFAAAVVLGLVP